MTISDLELMQGSEERSLPPKMPLVEAARAIFTPEESKDEDSYEHGIQKDDTQAQDPQEGADGIKKIIQACLRDAKKQSTT